MDTIEKELGMMMRQTNYNVEIVKSGKLSNERLLVLSLQMRWMENNTGLLTNTVYRMYQNHGDDYQTLKLRKLEMS